jgi:hypothetical protein
VGSVRSIRQAWPALFLEPVDPFVPGLLTNAVRITERGDGVLAAHRLLNKVIANSHEIGSPPGHAILQRVRTQRMGKVELSRLTHPPGLRLTYPPGPYPVACHLRPASATCNLRPAACKTERRERGGFRLSAFLAAGRRQQSNQAVRATRHSNAAPSQTTFSDLKNMGEIHT